MRKRFLVKPALQIRHLLWTFGIVLICSLSFYALVETGVSRAVANGSLGLEQWLSLRGTLRFAFVLGVLVLAVATGIENYLFFHRVVGPLYALEKAFRR